MPPFLPMRKLTQFIGLAAFIVGSVSCAGNSSVVVDVAKLAWQNRAPIDATMVQVLHPAYRYLRVTLAGRPFLMVLGYVDTDPITAESIDVWYTGQGEVLRLKNGRLVGMTGVQADWLAVRHHGTPEWSVAASMKQSDAASYTRVRDLKSMYQLDVEDQVTLHRIPAPTTTILPGLASTDLLWLEERYVSRSPLPPSQFAIQTALQGRKQHRVVYSVQCLSPQMCLSFQEWTPQDHIAAQQQAQVLDRQP